MPLKKITNLLEFPNGNIAVFDQYGQQIAPLQQPLWEMWAEKAVALGYDPEGLHIGGRTLHYTEACGWRWS